MGLSIAAVLAALAGLSSWAQANDSTPRIAATPRPAVIQRPIPFPPVRKRETAAYARRHYGIDGYRLSRPRVIVEHFTANDSVRATFNTFAPDVPDSELHELPATCSHYVIDRDGRIYQLVSTQIICRHTVGLNYTAIGIEHVGFSDSQVLGDPRQLRASLRLTRYLQARYGIATRNVIGHNESLSSPYHRERVARLRNQTHGDFRRASMNRYRRALGSLAAAGACSQRPCPVDGQVGHRAPEVSERPGVKPGDRSLRGSAARGGEGGGHATDANVLPPNECHKDRHQGARQLARAR